ncbi:hypothetical protein NMY22_g17852 [Coprinellus aureogranulatus]|nr:hypothetical protein NMY22_g17852 [Coprinellus aureogranulatus]
MRGEYPSWDRVVDSLKSRVYQWAPDQERFEYGLTLARELPKAPLASVATVLTRMSETRQTQWTVRDSEVVVPTRRGPTHDACATESYANDWKTGNGHSAFVEFRIVYDYGDLETQCYRYFCPGYHLALVSRTIYSLQVEGLEISLVMFGCVGRGGAINNDAVDEELWLFSTTIMDVELQITWAIPFHPEDHSEEELDRIHTAICEFSDSPATFEWFKVRGYTLFERNRDLVSELNPFPRSFSPRVPTNRATRAEYPFPHHNRHPLEKQDREKGKIWFAQDSQGRHVVINLVPAESDELRVYEFLREQTIETMKSACIIPVLDILSLAHCHFVVMPRWGDTVMFPEPRTLKEVLGVLHSMLKALNFLHSHDIVHRDIAFKNVLVNHYSDSIYDPIRSKLRSAGELSYAVIDFDLAIPFSPSDKRRLPVEKALDGTIPHPDDAAESTDGDYDPFAFDVGCMGMLFCTVVQAYTAELPFLAPFLDGMTARNVSRRFTINQALHFFESHLKDIPRETLEKPYKDPEMAFFDSMTAGT